VLCCRETIQARIRSAYTLNREEPFDGQSTWAVSARQVDARAIWVNDVGELGTGKYRSARQCGLYCVGP